MNIDLTPAKEIAKLKRQLKKAMGIAHVNCKWRGVDDGACHNKGTSDSRCDAVFKGKCPILSPLDDAETE
jgi:hypothetical protein